jgi:predicted transposase/invertase (TIGR01784 family)
MKLNEKFYGFTNYLVFPAVITRRPQLLKKIIQLYFPDIIIGELRTEKTHPENFVPMLKQKSVRMDIKTTDSEERRIIAEMIAYEDGAIEVRIQNYIAADYVDQRKRGEAYRETETIALIISAFKVNDDEKAISRYRFVNPDNPRKRLKSSPELLVIFYNGNEEGLSDEQKDFLAYLRTGISPDQCSVLTEEVHREVNAVNHDQDWRENLMTLEEILEYEKKKARKEAFEEGNEEGRKQGVEEGRKQGAEEGRITALAEMLKALMTSTGKSLNGAAEMLQLNEEDLEKVTSSGLLD